MVRFHSCWRREPGQPPCRASALRPQLGLEPPSPSKRLQQLGGGFRRWGLGTIGLQPHLPNSSALLGWMTSQLYPLPHSTGTSIPKQQRSCCSSPVGSPTNPKLLPAAWGRRGAAEAGRQLGQSGLTSWPNSGSVPRALGMGMYSPCTPPEQTCHV